MSKKGFISFVTSIILLSQVLHIYGENREPACSRFHYEEQLLEKMIRMEIKFEALLDSVKKLETSVKSDLQAFKDEREEEKREFAKLKIETDDAVKALVTRITELAVDQEQNVARLSADLVDIRNQTIISIDKAKPKAVAFEAHKLTNRGPGVGDTITFSETKVNLGGGYNSANGHFTTPVDGVYLVMVQVCLQSSNWIYLDIMVNGEVQTAGQASAYHWYFCYSRQAVLNLKSGDDVWVQCANRYDSTTFTESVNHVNSFSGVLIG